MAGARLWRCAFFKCSQVDWNVPFQALVAFKSKHGHTNVPEKTLYGGAHECRHLSLSWLTHPRRLKSFQTSPFFANTKSAANYYHSGLNFKL
jgi:hypothetical protein